MKLTKLPVGVDQINTIRAIVDGVSHEHFNDNLKLDSIAQLTRSSARFKLGVRDSKGPGSRRAASGRHGPWASWEANRLVMAALFETWPNATLQTALITYRGKRGFDLTHELTQHKNTSTIAAPAFLGKLTNHHDC